MLANAKALCEIDSQNVAYLWQLGFALDYLGMACLEFGELDEAERWLTAFRDNRQAAVDADPADQDARRSLALAHQNLGDLAERRRDFDTARAAYRQAVIGMEEIARRNSKSVMAYRDQTVALLKTARARGQRGPSRRGRCLGGARARGPDRQAPRGFHFTRSTPRRWPRQRFFAMFTV